MAAGPCFTNLVRQLLPLSSLHLRSYIIRRSDFIGGYVRPSVHPCTSVHNPYFFCSTWSDCWRVQYTALCLFPRLPLPSPTEDEVLANSEPFLDVEGNIVYLGENDDEDYHYADEDNDE